MQRETQSQEWVGHVTEQTDVITDRLIEEFRATLAPHLASGMNIPPGIFLCLAPDIKESMHLGPDGHIAPGRIGPDLGLPRRMWAGGEFIIHAEFRAHEPIKRINRIEAISFKDGSTGPLAFLTMRRRYEQDGKLIVDERQDIVYREAAKPDTMSSAQMSVEHSLPVASPTCRIVNTDPALLFRYSAITFNGHRIHYDFPYATEVEAYRGLVVHGPMQATLILNLATDCLGRLPRKLSYRGVSPLICGTPFAVIAETSIQGQLSLRTQSSTGTVAMTASAE